jgi:transposase
MYPFYLGIDLHLKRTYVVLLDQAGEVHSERQLDNTELASYVATEVPRETCAVLEATRNWPYVYDLLAAHVQQVELAHPKQLKAISTAAVKTDRIDARTLAHLARMNYLPKAYAPPPPIRDARLEVRHRDRLVRQRTQAKNRIHAVLAQYGLVSPQQDLFGPGGRTYLARVMLTEMRVAAVRVITRDLALIDHLTEQITDSETTLGQGFAGQTAVKLLQTIPGVGWLGAVTLLAEIGSWQRFQHAKSLCNWAGLTPRVHSSDRQTYHGRISKQGPALVRATMTRAATVASRFSPRWRQVHTQLLQRTSRTSAKVALARRLLTVAYYMLKRQEPYQEDHPSAVQ